MAVHLFILYWGMVSFITPPVALGAFAAASLARANPIATGWEAVRLGAVIYVAPFFFVVNPALIGQGPAAEIVLVLASALVGIWFIGAAMQGYVAFVGSMGTGVAAVAMRVLLAVAGFLVAAPVKGLFGLGQIEISLFGLALATLPLFSTWRQGRIAEASRAVAAGGRDDGA